MSNTNKQLLSKGLISNRSTILYDISYRLFGELVRNIELRGLRRNLRYSALRITYEMYLSSMIFVSLITSLVSLLFIILFNEYISEILNKLDLIRDNTMLYVIPLYIFIITFIFMYIYPAILSSSRKNSVEREITDKVCYIAFLSTTNMTLTDIIAEISKTKGAIANDFKRLLYWINIGYDIISALYRLSEESPSYIYRKFLTGLIQSYKAGNITTYLTNMADTLMDENRQRLIKITENMSIINEMYVTILVVFPILSIIMFVIIGMLGFDLSNSINSTDLMRLIVYIVLPIIGSIMLLVADSIIKR
jgi:hypothetical protein